MRSARTVRRRASLAALIGAACLAGLSGCATFSDTISTTERALVRQDPKLALATYEKRKPGSADRVLYLMNVGMLQRMNGDYDASIRTLQQAKALIENLRAVSLREQALSLVVNDATKAFIGDDYEQVMVHTYLALDYLQLHRLDDARVEVLQVDVLLRQLAEGTKSKYVEDAFARYLAGMIYEEEGEWSDAMIAYRKAYDAYKAQQSRYGVEVPEPLRHDLIRLADKMGLTDEAQRYRDEFGIKDTLSEEALSNGGELIFIFQSGLSPIKREKAIMANNPNTGRLIRLAMPEYQVRRQPDVHARISLDDKSARTFPAENIDAIAVNSLADHMPLILARTLARAVAKDRIAKEASDRGGAQGAGPSLLGVVVNLANTLTERADTRSWFTLPSQIGVARLPVPPGRYRGRIEILRSNGTVLQSSDFQAELAKGQKAFITRYWISPNLRVKP